MGCADKITSCLADESCSAGQACVDACPCGSNSCLAACAFKHPSAKGAEVLACVEKNCASDVDLQGLPDCSKTGCPAKCQCAESKCADEITGCLADASCSAAQACVDACPCGSNSCLATCAIKHPSVKLASVLACVEKNCPA